MSNSRLLVITKNKDSNDFSEDFTDIEVLQHFVHFNHHVSYCKSHQLFGKPFLQPDTSPTAAEGAEMTTVWGRQDLSGLLIGNEDIFRRTGTVSNDCWSFLIGGVVP